MVGWMDGWLVTHTSQLIRRRRIQKKWAIDEKENSNEKRGQIVHIISKNMNATIDGCVRTANRLYKRLSDEKLEEKSHFAMSKNTNR